MSRGTAWDLGVHYTGEFLNVNAQKVSFRDTMSCFSGNVWVHDEPKS